MKILITGASGLLGKSLLETKPSVPASILTLTWLNNIYGVSLGADTWHKLDVRNRADVYLTFEKVKPDIVIHCAAIGSVDYAESNYDDVISVNLAGTINVANAAKHYGTKMVYISSNAVYDGNSPPYNETSPLNPVNAYGSIKVKAERYVQDISDDWLVIRPFLLYGWSYQGGRSNWGSTIVKSLREQKTLKLVNDYVWMPTYAPDCADAIWRILLDGGKGFYNVASPERLTLYEFGLIVCKVFELDKSLLEPVSSSYFGGIARRPRDTTFWLSKLVGAGVSMDNVEMGLKKMRDSEVKE